MSFQIHALPAESFHPLFKMTEQQLNEVQATRMVVDASAGYPCRVSLDDAEIGETVILVNYQHQPGDSPYQSTHAIFVRENVTQAFPRQGEVPESLTTRLISVRAFDDRHYMVNADVVDGTDLGKVIPAMFEDSNVAYLHLHNARPGCYAARATRA
jgi:hypothetical protein